MGRYEILKKVANALEDLIDQAEEASRKAQEESNQRPGRAEARYESAKAELANLARAHRVRAQELRIALDQVHSLLKNPQMSKRDGVIVLGSTFTVESGDSQVDRYILSPAGGGLKISVGAEEFFLITLTSPFGSAAIGKKAGDEINLPGMPVTHKILEVF